MPSNKVLFKFGTQAAYRALTAQEIESNALYFLTDTGELFRGNIAIGQAKYYAGTLLQSDASEAAAITRIVGASIPVVNDILILSKDNNVKTPYIFAAYEENSQIVEGWVPLIDKIDADDVVFSDGDSIQDKIADAVSGITGGGMDYNAFDTNVFDILQTNGVDSGITLRDYGAVYYTSDGQGGYTAVTVDQQHPWITGLTPKVISYQGSTVLGWVEPDASTAAGQAAAVATLQQDVADLKTLLGRATNGNEIGTGIVKRVEDLESATVQGIRIGNTTLNPVNNILEIPIFNGSNNGLVPQPVANLNNAIQVLGSNGQWCDPKDLFSIEWEEISQQS